MAQSSLGSPGLLSAGALAAGDIATDRSFARDLNLDQIVAAIAGDREERELITRVLFAPLHDADAVRYRREVFHDLENPACSGRSSGFPGSSARYVPTCASRRRCRTATSGRAPIGSPALLAFRADSTLFLRAERQPDGRRDYKLAVKDPLRGRPVLPARRSAR